MTKTYLTNREYGQAKGRLTRAINSHDPLRVAKLVEEVFDDWDARCVVYPDDWRVWQWAYNSALDELNRQR